MERKNNDLENDIDLQEILQEKLNALKKPGKDSGNRFKWQI